MKQSLRYTGFGLVCRTCGYQGEGIFQLSRETSFNHDRDYQVFCEGCWPAEQDAKMERAAKQIDASLGRALEDVFTGSTVQ